MRAAKGEAPGGKKDDAPGWEEVAPPLLCGERFGTPGDRKVAGGNAPGKKWRGREQESGVSASPKMTVRRARAVSGGRGKLPPKRVGEGQRGKGMVQGAPEVWGGRNAPELRARVWGTVGLP